MEMVAASKMRRAQDRMELGKPYARRIRDVVGHIANAVPEYRHAYMEQREVKRVGYVIVSTDRGLWRVEHQPVQGGDCSYAASTRGGAGGGPVPDRCQVPGVF